MPSIYIATPIHHAPEATFVMALLRTTHALTQRGIHHEMYLPAGDSLVTRARNDVVARFLDTLSSHLLFIDSDIIFTPDDVIRLLSVDLDVVGGLYPKKGIDWGQVNAAAARGARDLADYSVRYVVNVTAAQMPGIGECVAVDALGTGFLMVARSVIERMRDAYPETHYLSDDDGPESGGDRWALFDAVIHGKRYLSEDFTFCLRARQLGIQPYAHTGIALGHVGRHVFRGDLRTLFTRAEE